MREKSPEKSMDRIPKTYDAIKSAAGAAPAASIGNMKAKK
jgi:hypothetical protein